MQGDLFPGIEYIVFSMAFLAIGIPLGLLAILIALLRRLTAARLLGKFCVGAGVLGAAILGYLLFSNSVPMPVLFILLIPAALGGVTLAIAYYYKDRPPLGRWQVPFPALIYVTLVVAGAAGIYKMSQTSFYRERDQCLANFQRMPGIDNVVVHGHEVSRFEVDSVQFSLAGRPDTLVKLGGQEELFDCKSSDRLESLAVLQIGPWTFGGQGKKPRKGSTAEEPLFSKFGIYALSFGPDSPLRDLVPLKIESVDDLVEHYDELVELLESWPRKEAPGHLERGDETLDYWVIDNRPPNRDDASD
ncbi:hypothetical protein LOC68_15735 [Blastopirellula sp. JC732]|uniref:Transmembrane protein n=1 Tax=Blastopirellula sediminis TaxID=2894196 RepID=A0A9X1MN51_9BACT|nr:hypothetical protein [Blastopirellula sediminis]MCC9606863.1 hypothetical protein [Blastopirellula sediminis]MCC9629841.1 hypothetical protein [Blastopirellula sediminis]